jgi:cellobiose-specific phosphotransferase system component IIC
MSEPEIQPPVATPAQEQETALAGDAGRASQVAVEAFAESRAAGQRRINIIWEVTQATIAVMVAGGTLFIAGRLALSENKDATTAFLLLSNAFFMIVTFYYQRTNHTRSGGPGGDSAGTR